MSSVNYSTQIRSFCYQCEGVLSSKQETIVDINKKAIKKVEKLMTCSRCHIASYCSTECQKLHWKKHKISCIENHTAFYGMDRPTLLITIINLFQNTNISSMPNQVHMGYGRIILKLNKEKNFEEIDGRYCVEGDKIFESFRLLIPSEISHLKNETPNSFTKERISYLEQLNHIAENFKDRYVVDVTIRLLECVGNFQFKICLAIAKEGKSNKD